jgi:L-ribulose-5-phosphate 4-epimerase
VSLKLRAPVVWTVAVMGLMIVTTIGINRATSQSRQSDEGVAALKEKVAFATRMLTREHILTSSGHVSVRIPGTDRVLIGPANVSREILRGSDIVTVTLDSKKVEGADSAPLETEIHTGIYRARPDVVSVIHSHPVHSVVFSVTGKPILPVSVHGAIFADGVPVFSHVGHINTRELGDGLARTLGSRRAALIKMHGAVIVGKSIEEAFVAALQLEENAEKQLWAEATGTATPMTAEEAERSVRQSFSPNSIAKRWSYYQEREKLGTH